MYKSHQFHSKMYKSHQFQMEKYKSHQFQMEKYKSHQFQMEKYKITSHQFQANKSMSQAFQPNKLMSLSFQIQNHLSVVKLKFQENYTLKSKQMTVMENVIFVLMINWIQNANEYSLLADILIFMIHSWKLF